MNGIGSSQLDALATSTGGVGSLLLKKALNSNESQMATLLQGLPQKDGVGQIVDVQA